MKIGCFASATIFSRDSEVCRNCEWFNPCSEESIKTLQALKTMIDVSDLAKRHDAARKRERIAAEREGEVSVGFVKRPVSKERFSQPLERKTKVEKVTFELDEDEIRIIESLPSKAKPFAERLCSSDMISQIKLELSNGRNALDNKKPEFLRVAIDALLDNGFSKSELRQRFVDEFEWREASAQSHVSFTVPILVGFGIAQEVDGRFKAVPATGS